MGIEPSELDAYLGPYSQDYFEHSKSKFQCVRPQIHGQKLMRGVPKLDLVLDMQ